MNKQQLEQEIAQLKMDYIGLQGDIEKLESTGNSKMIENAERRLAGMEDRLADLNKQLATTTE
ncbi:SE1832 family protein [Sporosarcina obsidiansis]|uniref:SE1832 family protein n=1 Tax=Sporosarcina obsidiansis TaxID=2660748 RepID=UPI00129C1072|nr:SE1832 family protein [Sporosarcina obsidiansis]